MASYFDTRPTIEEFDVTIANQNVSTGGTIVYNFPTNKVGFVKVRQVQVRETLGGTRFPNLSIGSNLSTSSLSFPIVNLSNVLKHIGGWNTAGSSFVTVYNAEERNETWNISGIPNRTSPSGLGVDLTANAELIEFRNLTQVKAFTFSGVNTTGWETRVFLRVYLFGT